MVKSVDLTFALGELGWPWPLTLTFQGALHWDKTIVFCLSFYGQYRLKYRQKCKCDLDLGWHWMTLILTLTHMTLILDFTHFWGTRWEKVNGFGLESIRSILKNVNLTLNAFDLDLEHERNSMTSWTLYFFIWNQSDQNCLIYDPKSKNTFWHLVTLTFDVDLSKTIPS